MAADLIGAELAILSAGHGIVRENQEIAAYGLTVAPGKSDSIQSKIRDEAWSSAKWWRALGDYAAASISLSEYFEQASADLVLIALSENYATLLSSELASLDEESAQKMRVFGAGLAKHLPANIQHCLMPYDARLNGPQSPINGTMTDFPTRALHHFAMALHEGRLCGRSSAEDRCQVEEMLKGWSAPVIPVRKKMSDQEVISFVLKNWGKTDGRSGATLRLLRDSGNACEQTRFKDLFKHAAASRVKSEVGAA
ncbi:hypothetical protein [Roseovarius atlanticus]|uniref:hypothetical protein n=1 Tax=Roseovarius atlanticus TaxID=1641875 RepID=UPI001F253689|nr:hypothetical protein [Roseovarius atlanticus]